MHKHSSAEKNIRIAIFLNIVFTIIEVTGGLWTNSVSILTDALHDFGDSISLIVSWIAEKKAQKDPDSKRTFGYKRLSLFASLFTAGFLITGTLFIISKAIPRLLYPEHVNSQGMTFLAIIGIVFNGLGVLSLKKGKTLNEKVVFWHLLEDVLGWIVILIGSLIITIWDNHRIDPLITIGYSAFIILGVSRNIKETFNIFLQGVPKDIDVKHIKKGLLALKEIKNVHDIHVWSLEGETNIFTAHVVLEKENIKDLNEAKKRVKSELKKHNIKHSTIELEWGEDCSGYNH